MLKLLIKITFLQSLPLQSFLSRFIGKTLWIGLCLLPVSFIKAEKLPDDLRHHLEEDCVSLAEKTEIHYYPYDLSADDQETIKQLKAWSEKFNNTLRQKNNHGSSQNSDE